MKKYRPILVFILIAFLVNLAMTRILFNEEFNIHPLTSILIKDFIESIAGGLIFVWMWNYLLKKKRIQG